VGFLSVGSGLRGFVLLVFYQVWRIQHYVLMLCGKFCVA
jgi:hypothetical protein